MFSTSTYDGSSLRVKKVAGSTTTRYIFSGTKVVAEYSNGVLSTEYIYAGSQVLATLNSSGTPTYVHPDHLSARVFTNSSGTKIGERGHLPFGEVRYDTLTTNKWKFTTYERDPESSLDYATFRYDSSRLGRFMTPDPLAGSIGNPQSLNRYAYVLNDPINLVDPLGLEGGCPPGCTPVYHPDFIDGPIDCICNSGVDAAKRGGTRCYIGNPDIGVLVDIPCDILQLGCSPGALSYLDDATKDKTLGNNPRAEASWQIERRGPPEGELLTASGYRVNVAASGTTPHSNPQKPYGPTAAYFHTHPYSSVPSPQKDKPWIEKNGIPIFVYGPTAKAGATVGVGWRDEEGKYSSNDPLPPGPLPYALITNPQSLNKYSYAYNSPLRYTDPTGHQHDGLFGLVRDWLDVVEVEVSAGIQVGAKAQLGTLEGKREITLVGVEGKMGLGGGNKEAKVTTGGELSVNAGPAQGTVKGGMEISSESGGNASAEVSGTVGPVTGGVVADKEGIQPVVSAEKEKDVGIGAAFKGPVGVGVTINFSQAGRAADRTAESAKALVGAVAERLRSTIDPVNFPISPPRPEPEKRN